MIDCLKLFQGKSRWAPSLFFWVVLPSVWIMLSILRHFVPSIQALPSILDFRNLFRSTKINFWICQCQEATNEFNIISGHDKVRFKKICFIHMFVKTKYFSFCALNPGEYVSLYQQQRFVLRKRMAEKDGYIHRLTQERIELQSKFVQLQTLVVCLLNERQHLYNHQNNVGQTISKPDECRMNSTGADIVQNGDLDPAENLVDNSGGNFKKFFFKFLFIRNGNHFSSTVTRYLFHWSVSLCSTPISNVVSLSRYRGVWIFEVESCQTLSNSCERANSSEIKGQLNWNGDSQRSSI